jgi:hypothetical protein
VDVESPNVSPVQPHWHLSMMGRQCSHIMYAEQNDDKDKRQEEPFADAETPSHDGPASPAEFDSNQTRALWKVRIRARGKVTTKASMNIHDPSPEVAEVCAARGFKARISFHRVSPFVLTKVENDRDLSHTSAKIRQNH